MTAPHPGLCGACRHSRVVESRRRSIFRLCERAATDPRFARYPTLPVLRCAGFEPRTRLETDPGASDEPSDANISRGGAIVEQAADVDAGSPDRR